jgi:hypothetical protein
MLVQATHNNSLNATRNKVPKQGLGGKERSQAGAWERGLSIRMAGGDARPTIAAQHRLESLCHPTHKSVKGRAGGSPLRLDFDDKGGGH